MTDRLVHEGRVAVLVSPNHGGGWSTWNQEHGDAMLFDPQIADIMMSDESRTVKIEKARAIAELKYPDAYLGGIKDLEVWMLTPGTKFYIDERDGSETVITPEDIKWTTA